MTFTAKLHKNGAFTIPASLRKELGLKAGDKLRWAFDEVRKQFYFKKV